MLRMPEGSVVKLDLLDILEVWSALGGGPLRGKRGQAFWRDGDGYSIALEPAKGSWYDHRDARGGGVLALVETALGCDRQAALGWLEANCGLDDLKLTPAERRNRAELNQKANLLAQRLSDFHRGLCLAVHRLSALNEALIIMGVNGPEVLADDHRAAFILQQAGSDDIVKVWRNSPGERDAIEAIGRADREHAEQITKALVYAFSTLQETAVAP